MLINTNATNSDTITFPKGITLADFCGDLMKDPKFRQEYYKPDDIGAELAIIRKVKGITQKELANKVGTKQPGIARAEKWGQWPTLRLLYKMAKALNCHLEIEVKENL